LFFFVNISGAFLVTYFVAMLFCGIPIFFQEVAIGQYLGSGGMTLVGKLCPILSGKTARDQNDLSRRINQTRFNRRHGIRDDDHSVSVGRVLLRNRRLDVFLLGELFRVVPVVAVGELR